MYTRPTISLKIFARNGARPLFLMIIYSGSIYYAYEHMGMEYIDLPLSISTVLGFAVSLLVGFRTNSAYDRWWEGRKIWGAIVNDSRSFMRQFISFADVNEEEKRSIANLIIGWCYALKSTLREQDPIKAIGPYIPEDKMMLLCKHKNVPNGLLTLIGEKLKDMRGQDAIDTFQYISLNDTLNRMCDSMGKCERIKKTVFPIEYRLFTKTAIFIFMLMLPFGMLKSTGIFVILISTVVLFFFLFMERIAHYMQNPFRNKPSDTPMSAICRTIEINLLQMIGVENVPDPIKPDKKGILM